MQLLICYPVLEEQALVAWLHAFPHVVCMQPRLMWDPLGSWAVAYLHRRRTVGRLGGGRTCPRVKDVGTASP